MEILESAGDMHFSFTAVRRGEACDPGFVRVQMRGLVDAVELETTYPLCDDGTPDDFGVNVTIGGEVGDQHNFNNVDCPIPGSFVMHSLGGATGEAYSFELSGTVMEHDRTGAPTGVTAPVEVSSEGVVEVFLEL